MELPMETPTPLTDPEVPTALTGTTRNWLTLAGTSILLVAATVVVVALAAVTLGPKVLPYQALVVRSGSMSPTIPTGSVVFYRKIDAAKVKVGDVIVFAKPGQADEKVTHRVFQISRDPNGGRYFTTKGDANGTPDSWRVPAAGTGWIAVTHVPVAGYVLADIQSPLGRLLLLLIPAVLLGAITLYEIVTDKRAAAKA
jgi:signal peptidase